MTEEFLKKVMKANEKAIIAYKNQDSKFLNDLEKNKKYADMYLELVLSFIEVFNYRKGTFDIEEITKECILSPQAKKLNDYFFKDEEFLKKFKKSVTKKTSTKTTYTIKKLKKSKTYYVRVRAYKIDSAGKKVYSKYSKVVKVSIKK